MISDGIPQQAFVWIWLPGRTTPVVAGRIAGVGTRLVFNYGKSYLGRKDAIPIYNPELPLQPGVLPLPDGLVMPGCIRDASPDAWGRRVLINRFVSNRSLARGTELDELTYLLHSGSDRTGALDFQDSAETYVPRSAGQASLADLMRASDLIQQGTPMPPGLEQAIRHGTSMGGARPKVLLEDGGRKLIAKFSAVNDIYSVVKAEFVAMRLAAAAGLDVAPVSLVQAAGKDVLLVERFDRIETDDGWARKAMVSALTILGLDEMWAREASYETLAEIVRHRFTDAGPTLHEVFGRIVFNILCGNTDDHARNHAAFWDGRALTLTPAYDICPQSRTGGEAVQSMLIIGSRRTSNLATCLDAASKFHLGRDQAIGLISQQIAVIKQRWNAVCDDAAFAEVDRRLMWGRQFLNPFAFHGAPEELAAQMPDEA